MNYRVTLFNISLILVFVLSCNTRKEENPDRTIWDVELDCEFIQQVETKGETILLSVKDYKINDLEYYPVVMSMEVATGKVRWVKTLFGYSKLLNPEYSLLCDNQQYYLVDNIQGKELWVSGHTESAELMDAIMFDDQIVCLQNDNLKSYSVQVMNSKTGALLDSFPLDQDDCAFDMKFNLCNQNTKELQILSTSSKLTLSLSLIQKKITAIDSSGIKQVPDKDCLICRSSSDGYEIIDMNKGLNSEPVNTYYQFLGHECFSTPHGMLIRYSESKFGGDYNDKIILVK